MGELNLNLEKNEAKVYIVILAFGHLTTGKLVNYLNIPWKDTESAIKTLLKKEYIIPIEGISDAYRAVLPFNELKGETTNIINSMDSVVSELDKFIIEKIKNLSDKLKTETESIDKSFSEAKDNVTNTERKSKGEIEDCVAKIIIEIDKKSDLFKKETEKITKDSQKEMKDLAAGLKNKHLEFTSSMNDNFNKQNESLQSTFSEKLESHYTEEVERKNAVKQDLDKIASESITSIDSGIEEVKTSLNNVGQEVLNGMDERKTKLVTGFSNQSEALLNTTYSSITSMSTKITENFSTTKTSANESLDATKSNMKSSITTSNTKFNEETLRLSSEVDKLFTSKIEEFTKSMDTTLEDLKNSFESIVKQSKEKFTTDVSELDKTIKDKMQIYSESYTSNSEGLHKNLDNESAKILTDIQTSFNSTLSQTESDVSSEFSGLKDQIANLGKDSVDKNQSELESMFNENKIEIESKIDAFKEALIPQKEALIHSINEFSKNINSLQDTSLADFRTKLDTYKSEVINAKDEISNLINTNKKEIETSIKETFTNLEKELDDFTNKSKESQINTVSGEAQTTITKINELKESLKSLTNNISDTITKQLETTAESVSSGIQHEISILESGLVDFTAKFKEVTFKTQDVFNNHLDTINEINRQFKETEIPKTQTLTITGKEAVKRFIDSMFERIKGGINLLIPNPSEIPVELIMKTKSHQRVEIITVVDTSAHGDLIEKLFSKSNVRIRNIDIQRFPESQSYIGADKDGEEVVLGVKEDNGEIVGITSQSDSFVKLIGVTVMGDLSRSRSHELKRADFGL